MGSCLTCPVSQARAGGQWSTQVARFDAVLLCTIRTWLCQGLTKSVYTQTAQEVHLTRKVSFTHKVEGGSRRVDFSVTPEELCDDGNQSNDDACLTNCTWRAPAANGVSGVSC